VEPLVWRRILVPGALPLDQLHSVIQAVMGWENRHLHVFEIHGERYAPPDVEGDEVDRDLDEGGVQLHQLLALNDRFTYEYDFGDRWVHDVHVETVADVDTPLRQAVCLEGARACPPEDSGGPSRFETLWKSWGTSRTRNTSTW
jgi:hypothetical protein